MTPTGWKDFGFQIQGMKGIANISEIENGSILRALDRAARWDSLVKTFAAWKKEGNENTASKE